MVTNAYPGFAGFTSEADAYTKSYTIAAANIAANPTVTLWEVGNENDINGNGPLLTQLQATGRNGALASDWRGLAVYPLYRGATAGAIAAIRDHASSATVIGGAIAGWTYFGLELAYATDLVAYAPQGGRNLMWDLGVEHWYNDATGGGNTMGDPTNFAGGSGGPFNIYTALKAPGRPLIFTEIGSSDVNNVTLDSQAGTNLTTLMANFKSHAATTGTTTGCVGGCIYQLYQMPGVQTDYFLYNISGSTATISAQGTAVKNWISVNP
jgi:hypothetical protein